MFTSIKKFLSPVRGSVQGEINDREIVRAGVLGVVSGSSSWALLSALLLFVQYTITYVVNNPNAFADLQGLLKLASERDYISIMITLSTFVLDYLRRKYMHGMETEPYQIKDR